MLFYERMSPKDKKSKTPAQHSKSDKVENIEMENLQNPACQIELSPELAEVCIHKHAFLLSFLEHY